MHLENFLQHHADATCYTYNMAMATAVRIELLLRVFAFIIRKK